MSCPFLERDRVALCRYETSHQLSRRLEEILMFSASSFSEKKILMKEINFTIMADRLRESFQGLAREKMIAIEFHPFPAFPLFRGDERWREAFFPSFFPASRVLSTRRGVKMGY